MKITISTALLSLVGTAYAGSGSLPSISVNIQDGSFSSLDGIDPLVSYSTEASVLGLDVEAGATASIKPTRDIMSMPRSLWGKVSAQILGWDGFMGVKVAGDYSNPTIDLAVKNDDLDASIKVGGLNKIEIDKGFDALGGRFSITPRYNIESAAADITLAYDSDDTTVAIDASQSQQKLTVSQLVAEGHRITPSVTSSGDVSVAWKKDLDSGNSVTTTITPGDKVSVKWEDGPWVAEFDSTLNGLQTEGLSVKVNRKITFF